MSLTDCFDLFTQEEVLDGDEKPVSSLCASYFKLILVLIESFFVLSKEIKHLMDYEMFIFMSFQTCARCKTRRKCTKSFSIQKFPKVLIIRILVVQRELGQKAEN